MPNEIAGNGLYSHEVPTEVGETVLMKDAHHPGTKITRLPGGRFLFEDIGLFKAIRSFANCALVRGLDLDLRVSHSSHVVACDLDTPDGLFLIGFDTPSPSVFDLCGGTVIWTSQPATPKRVPWRTPTPDVFAIG